MTASHTHPCFVCAEPVECGGTYERNVDGWPEAVCSAYHLESGVTATVVCDDHGVELADGYTRKRKTLPAKRRYRTMTLAEVKALGSGDHVTFKANDGTARELKINGAVKTWKTDAARVEVPVKYGLREYARLDTREALSRLLVEVTT